MKDEEKMLVDSMCKQMERDFQMIPKIHETVRDNIHHICRRDGIRKREIASALNLPETGIFKRLNGVVKWRLDEIMKLADFLDSPVERIIFSPDEYNHYLAPVHNSEYSVLEEVNK